MFTGSRGGADLLPSAGRPRPPTCAGLLVNYRAANPAYRYRAHRRARRCSLAARPRPGAAGADLPGRADGRRRHRKPGPQRGRAGRADRPGRGVRHGPGTGYGEAVAVALRHAHPAPVRRDRPQPAAGRVDLAAARRLRARPRRARAAAAGGEQGPLRGGARAQGARRPGPAHRCARSASPSTGPAAASRASTPGEIDQGQHDHNRAVLAVGSAGMLVRRDVWDRLGGFDTAPASCSATTWTSAGGSRRPATACRWSPTPSCTTASWPRGGAGPPRARNARRLDRRNALYVLAVNLPLLTMLRVVGGCVVGSLVRAAYFLLTKQLDLAAAHALSVARAVRRTRSGCCEAAGAAPRAWRRATRRSALFIPPARTLSRLAETIAGLVSQRAAAGHRRPCTRRPLKSRKKTSSSSTRSPSLRRIIGQPGRPAVRRAAASSPWSPSAGCSAPARSAAARWCPPGAAPPRCGAEYLAGFHAVGVGSTASAPPYLAVVAALATVLGGQAWLAVDVLLLGCVPLAGPDRLPGHAAGSSPRRPARVLLAASYALLPVATGAVAAGRLGTAVAFVLLPLIAVSAGRMLTAAPRQARRAAWATGLLIAVAAAFAPLAWVLGVVFAAGAARRQALARRRSTRLNAAIVVVTPVLRACSRGRCTCSPARRRSCPRRGCPAPGLTTRGLSAVRAARAQPRRTRPAAGLGHHRARARPGRRCCCPHRRSEAGRRRLGRGRRRPARRDAGQPDQRDPRRRRAAGRTAGRAWRMALAALGLLLAAAPAAQWLATITRTDGGDSPARSGAAGGYGRPEAARLASRSPPRRPPRCSSPPTGSRTACAGRSAASPRRCCLPSCPRRPPRASQYRTLILRPGRRASLDYTVVRQGDPTLGEPELAPPRRPRSGAGPPGRGPRRARRARTRATPAWCSARSGSGGCCCPARSTRSSPSGSTRRSAWCALSKAPDLRPVAGDGPVARVRVVAADGTDDGAGIGRGGHERR